MNGCVACGAVARAEGLRRCRACHNAHRRARYASAQPQARREGKRTAHGREPGRHWCWWCQETHPRADFARNRSRRSGVAAVCREGMRTLYRLRTLSTHRVPARGRRLTRVLAPGGGGPDVEEP